MDLSLRRKGVWIAGSLCLLSSPVLWRVLRSVMTRGGHRQAPALEDTQVVTWPLSWLSVSGRGTGSPWQTECVSCLVLPRDGRPMGVGSGEVGSPCQHLQVSTNFRGPKRWAAAESSPGHLHSVSSQLCLLGNFLFEPLDSGRDRAGEGALPGRPEEGDSRHPEG